ncbi:MAG: hypothetical protein ACLRX5_00565 [Slackia sp.]
MSASTPTSRISTAWGIERLTRGLMMASVMGYLMGERLADEVGV